MQRSGDRLSPDEVPSARSGFVGMQRDERADAYGELLRNVRELLAGAMHEEGVSRAELARRLGVRPSVVTRVMNPDSDVLLSTLFDLSWALARQMRFELSKRDHAVALGQNAPAFDYRSMPTSSMSVSTSSNGVSVNCARATP